MVDMRTHPSIRDLIEERKRDTGWSYADLAHASGDLVTRGTIHSLATGTPKSWPKTTATITGLAQALNVPEETVVLAYATSFGVAVRSQPSLLALQLPATTDLLTATERAQIVGIIRSMTEGRSPAADDGVQ
ncbi:hypothetical protein AXK57_16400 [Tsukamurella pulmonis]|uniref:transcriptional regulator n=1 Tax=Tsukamurella pulmonis TaxID=47312 RepID=UPI0007957DA1|nr:transcriptional regulator [Tsukamurella pulmonis]KXP08063.1 hypothetical protein AXK57_16400 [Tsukamurella pulmonis]